MILKVMTVRMGLLLQAGRLRTFVLSCLLLSPLLAAGQGYGFRLDTATIALGDQTTLVIEPTAGGSQSVAAGTPTAEIQGEGIVVLGQRLDTATGALHTLITSFEPGEHWLHVGADSVLLTVQDVENVDTASVEIKDITAILRQPYTFWEVFRWVLLALLLAGLYLLWRYVWHPYFVKKMLKAGETVEPEKSLPPDVRALEALEALRLKKLWQQGRLKEYHTELTDIVRRYLAEAHGINSAEMTTGQTLEAFSASQVCTDETYRLLRQMLETADMVKFAKSEPPAYEHDRSMTAAVELVNELKNIAGETPAHPMNSAGEMPARPTGNEIQKGGER